MQTTTNMVAALSAQRTKIVNRVKAGSKGQEQAETLSDTEAW